MRRRTSALVAFPIATLLALPASTLPAEGAAPARTSGSGSTAQQSSTLTASDSAERKRKKRKNARGARPARALTYMSGLTNAVRVSWRPAPRATRYRVKWAYAPWDKWPSATQIGGWIPASQRSTTKAVSTNASNDYRMAAAPYANPVFTRVQTANAKRLGYWSQWRASYPAISRPADGDVVRLGTYNVMLAGSSNWARRMPRIAQNIAARGLTMVALQETMNTDGSGIASRLTSLTRRPWRVASTGASHGRILYDSSRYSVVDSGLLNKYSPSGQSIHSYRTGRVINTPYARFRAGGSNRTFTVVSIHFAPSNVRTGPTKAGNKQTGASARAVLAALGRMPNSGSSAVIAGDFAGGYARWGDPNPAQPTLVRAGWWDSMASLSRAGVTYSTVNGRRGQRSTLAVAGRADGIFLRNIRGSFRYSNVANYFMPGTRVPPSDHNLVWSEFRVPR